MFFNGYLNDNKIYKGYSPPANGILKLGPVFNNFWAAGDPGWKLTAHNDSIYWYLNQHAGDGDCLMGCTGGMDATYRISSNGTVERVACTSYSYNPVIDYCSNASIREKKQPQLNRNFQGDLYVYDLTGRFLGRISSHQFKRGRSGMAHLKLKPGVYIFKPENETGQWLLRRMVY